MEDAEHMETMGKQYLKSTLLRDFVRVRNNYSPTDFLVASLGQRQPGALCIKASARCRVLFIFSDSEHKWTGVI
jgi:hypothetical protein